MSVRCILAFLGILWFVSQPAPAASTLPRVLAAAEQLEAQTRQEMKRTGVPGLAIAIVYRDRLIYAQGFGIREVGKPGRVDADTVFQLASLSKPVGSTVVAALVGRGVLAWDSKIKDLDPGFAMNDPEVTEALTVADLYAHRSGLPEHIGDILEDIGFSREEILHRLRFQPLTGRFRKSYAYTNFGMTQGAVAAAKAAGVSWEDLSERVLYRPLGMDSTSSTFSGFLFHGNRARGHQRIAGHWLPGTQRQPDAQSPAGGVSSSVRDMARWMRLQLNDGQFEGRRIVDAKALQATHQAHNTTDNGGQYGYGWNVGMDAQGRLRLSHSGAFLLGAATTVFLVPAEQLGILILTNGEPIGLPEGLAATFLDNALEGRPTRDWIPLYQQAFQSMRDEELAVSRHYDTPPPHPAAPRAASTYTGTYANAFYGSAVVTGQDGKLTLHLGPDQQSFPLTPWDGNTFTFVTTGEMGAGTSGVFFTVKDATATAMRIEFFDRNHNGTLSRVTR